MINYRDRIDLPSRSTSVPFRIPFNSYLASIDDPGSGWSTRATAYRHAQCNRMHAQRDIHMAECLVHGNVALCTECISVIAIRHWAVARQYGTWIRIQNRVFCVHTLYLSLSLSRPSNFSFFPPSSFRSPFLVEISCQGDHRWNFVAFVFEDSRFTGSQSH